MPKRNRSWEFFEDLLKEFEIFACEKDARDSHKASDMKNQFRTFQTNCRLDLINTVVHLFIDDINHNFSNTETEKEVERASTIMEGLTVPEEIIQKRTTEMCEDVTEFYECQHQFRRYTYRIIKKRLRKFASCQEQIFRKPCSAESFPSGCQFWFEKELTEEDISGKLRIPRRNASELIEKSPEDSQLYQSFVRKKIKTLVLVYLHMDEMGGMNILDEKGTVGVIKEGADGDWQITWTGIRHLFQKLQIVKLQFRWQILREVYNLSIFVNPIE